MATDHSEKYKQRWADRSVPEFLRALVPDPMLRARCCLLIAESLRLANDIHSGRWGLSLRDVFLRANIGPAEAVLLTKEHLELMVDVSTAKQDGAPSLMRRLPRLSEGRYSSVPGSAYVAIPLQNDALFQQATRVLSRAHRAHIHVASKSGLNGMTRSGHHPGLVDAIAAEADLDVPQPAYVTVERPNDTPLSMSPSDSRTYIEGRHTEMLQTRYERDPVARRACVAHYGSSCVACGFDFGNAYGSAAVGMIHVHHLAPLGEEGIRDTDPIRDLRPVCANCHLVIHSDRPALTIQAVKNLLERSSDA